MRDMMATHERLEAHTREETRESLRKAAAAVFEALPALLLAGALLMPALAALAAKTAGQAAPAPGVELGQVIAAQGNKALVDIRAEQREALRQSLALPRLSS